MKISRVVTELDFGGVEQVLANSLPQLVKMTGVDVHVIVLGKGGRVSALLKSQGVSVEILNFNPRIPNFKLLLKLRKVFQHNRPDVIHCQGSEANFHGIIAGWLANVPRIIGEEIGIPNHHGFWKYLFRWVYRKADQVIAISEAVKESIVALGEVDAGKVQVIYNPIAQRIFKQGANGNYRKKEETGFRFVTTCRLVPIKNLERLIRAFLRLADSNPSLHLYLDIVGEGPDRVKLERLAADSGYGNRIRFWGFQEDVFPFLRNADVFVLPSLREGSSVALAEAMAIGLPSLVTEVGGAGEVLGNSDAGMLVNPLDESEILRGMQQFLQLGEERLKEMGNRAVAESKRFYPEAYIQTLLAVYNQ